MGHRCFTAAALGASLEKFDNFRMRATAPAELKQVGPDLYFLYDDISSNAAFLVTADGVVVIDTRLHPQHGRDVIRRIRKITDINVFIEALHHLFTTGKPMFAYP